MVLAWHVTFSPSLPSLEQCRFIGEKIAVLICQLVTHRVSSLCLPNDFHGFLPTEILTHACCFSLLTLFPSLSPIPILINCCYTLLSLFPVNSFLITIIILEIYSNRFLKPSRIILSLLFCQFSFILSILMAVASEWLASWIQLHCQTQSWERTPMLSSISTIFPLWVASHILLQ